MHKQNGEPLSDADRVFVGKLFEDYKRLIYVVAYPFFYGNQEDIGDALGEVGERMCRYVERFYAVDCNKMKYYVILVTENVCRKMLKERSPQREYEISIEQEVAENLPDSVDLYTSVFEYADAETLLESFDILSDREKEALELRYIAQMEIDEIAEEMNTTELAVRTLLSRAKRRVQQWAADKKGKDDENE